MQPSRCYATAPTVAEADATSVLDERRQGLLRRTFLDYMPHSAFEANPLVVERAKGLYYWDVTGKVGLEHPCPARWHAAARSP
jgi:4-aminobutyrate aminotransferase-like enzyme